MKTIRVESPGLLTTVQDFGREGYAAMGVSASGAADTPALRVGNRLVGNPENAAGLEMTLIGGTFVFQEDAVVALAGSDFGATIDNSPVDRWTSIQVKPSQTLRLGPSRGGARCYMCIGGGISVTPFLGSASTHVLSGLGGFAGRALRKGDVLQVADRQDEHKTRAGKRVAPQTLTQLAPRKVLRATPGPQSEWFSDSALRLFYKSSYRVAEESNRMGLRLAGVPIPADVGRSEMITEGVSAGAVQLPESGMPIILFVDQQTTGGYPKIANVIAADLGSVGQLRPRDEIRFEQVDWAKARALLRAQEELLCSQELILE